MKTGKEKALSLIVLADRIKATTRLIKAVFFVLSIPDLGGNYHGNSKNDER